MFKKAFLQQETGLCLLNAKGMTLLEILIVLGIIAGTITLFVSRSGGPNSELKDFTREIGVVSRDVYYRAKLNQVPYRLVIDMKSGPDSEYRHQYWVEMGEKDTAIAKDSTYEKFKKQKVEDKKTDSQTSESFSLAESVTKKPKDLPSGLFFKEVEVLSEKEPFSSGRVYIHFLPQGFVDEVAIHLQFGSKNNWTLSFNPLTGRVEITPKYIALKELIDQK